MDKLPYGIRLTKNTRDAFSAKCKEDKIGVSVAIEALMKSYISGDIRLINEIYAVPKRKEGTDEENH